MTHTYTLELPHGTHLACRANRPRGDASPARVVLLHGFPEAAFVWDEVLAMLAPQVHGVAPNLRGYVGSSSPTDAAAYRAKHLVADVAATIEALGAPIDLLVAHDWGGALAWNLAVQRPELMRHLLIINSPHPATFLRELRDSAAQQAASSYMNFLCRPDAGELLAADDFARIWPFFGGAVWLTEGLREQYRQAWGAGLEGPLNYYRASPLRPPQAAADVVNTLELSDDMVTVRVPTTVLWGEQDKALLPGLLNGLERWIPQLQIERVPDASHWIVHEQPARVAHVIQRCLSGPLSPG